MGRKKSVRKQILLAPSRMCIDPKVRKVPSDRRWWCGGGGKQTRCEAKKTLQRPASGNNPGPLLSARSFKTRRQRLQHHTLLPTGNFVSGSTGKGKGGMYIEGSVVSEGEEECFPPQVRVHLPSDSLLPVLPLFLFLFGGTGEQATG